MGRRLSAARGAANGAHPLTTTLPVLLKGGSDAGFRRFLYDFMTVAERVATLRAHFGREVGITGPQYTLLMAVLQLGDGVGVPPRAVADHLRVTRAFVALEAGRLVRAGVLAKRGNPADGRSNLLSLTPRGRRMLDRLIPEVRAVNDLFFSGLDGPGYACAQRLMARMLADSAKVLKRVARSHA